MFSVRVDQPAANRVIIVVTGEIDSITAPNLSMMLHRELESQPATLILDLSEVTFLGIAGLQVIDCVLDRTATLPTVLTLTYHDHSPVAAALRARTLAACLPTPPC